MEVKVAMSRDCDTKFPPFTSCFSRTLPTEHVEAESLWLELFPSWSFTQPHSSPSAASLGPRVGPYPVLLPTARGVFTDGGELPELPAELHYNPAGSRAGGHTDVESDQGSVRNNLLLLESETAAGHIAVSRAGG